MAEKAFNPIILSGVKKVLFTPWNGDTLDLTGDRYDLQNLVGDTVQINQDDNETTEVPCETRDEPLYEAIKLGKYVVSMESGDINPELLHACMGFAMNPAKTIAYAPAAYAKTYAHIEVQMDGGSFIVPRVLLGPKLNIESLKTGIARGTIAGSAYSVDIATTAGKKIATPFTFVKSGTTLGTISALGQGAGTYEDTGSAIIVDPTALSFPKAGGTKAVFVYGGGDNPTLTPSENWLTATFDNGVISVVAANNAGTSARTATLTVGTGDDAVEIPVTQAGS